MVRIEAGKVKPLGTSGTKRAAQLPNVPTVAETFPGFDTSSWNGFFAPKGTPPEVVAKLHDAFKKAMEDPSYVQALAKYDMVPMYMSSAGYAKFAQETFLKEKALIEKLGLAKPS